MEIRLIGQWFFGNFRSFPGLRIINSSAFFDVPGKWVVLMIELMRVMRMPTVFLGRFFSVLFVIWSGPCAFFSGSL